MSFGNPWALWMAAAIVPLIGAFLIRRWRRQRTVSSLVIYRRLMENSSTRRRFATPQHLVALLLMILAMAGLTLASLDLQGNRIEPRDYIVLLDNSASMETQEVGELQSRLERASEAITTFVAELNPEDRIALISSGAEAELLVGWTREHERVGEAGSQVIPVGTGSGMLAAFQIANAMCQEPENTEIVLVSDGAGVSIPPLGCPLRYVRVGQSAANVAITALTVREADALGLNEIYLAVHNGSEQPNTVTVELRLDQALVDVVSIEVEPHGTVERMTRLPLPDGDQLEARLTVEGENVLAIDDIAYAIMQPGAHLQTLLITEHPTTFVAEALQLHPRVDLILSSPSEVDPSRGPYDLLVIDSALAGDLPEADHLLILNAEAARLGLAESGIILQPDIIRWSFDHSLFRFVNLDQIHIASATAVSLPGGATSLVDMADGPLVLSMQYQEREVLYFAFHPDLSDLPLRIAFVNMMANIVEWAQPLDMAPITSNIPIGQRLTDRGAGITLTQVAGVPEGEPPVDLDASAPIPEPGIYRVDTAEGLTRGQIAANLFSVSETEVEPTNRLGVGAMYGFPEVQKEEAFPWWMLALAAICLIALEWLLPGLLSLGFRFRRRGRSNPKVGEGAKARPHAQDLRLRTIEAGSAPGGAISSGAISTRARRERG